MSNLYIHRVTEVKIERSQLDRCPRNTSTTHVTAIIITIEDKTEFQITLFSDEKVEINDSVS